MRMLGSKTPMLGSKTTMLGSTTPMHQGAEAENMQHIFKEVEDLLAALLSKEITKMAGLRPSNVPEKYTSLVMRTQSKDFQKIKSYATYGHGQSRT
jgi:hypothetical protein